MANAASKVYTDPEHGFSVDLDDVLYTEDSFGNKTYTFTIETKETDREILENLVLKDIGNSQFAAYISTYDKAAVENLDQFTLEDLKKHVTLISIGNKTASDIFGRYNANTCQITAPQFVNIFVSGAMCYENKHNYADIGSCNYKDTPGKAPTDSYSYTGISYEVINTCQGGGASTGNGGGGIVTTSPHGGSIINDPCNKTKAMLENPAVKAKIDSMKLKSTQGGEVINLKQTERLLLK